MKAARGSSARLRLWSILPVLVLPAAVPAATLDDVKAELTADIAAAQAELTATQDRIGRERQGLAQRINRAQAAVADLRDRAVAARRAADEETLSLQRIEERLSDWEEQSRFQQRLTSSFVSRATGSVDPGSDLKTSLAALRDYLAGTRDSLYPRWLEAPLVLENGQIGTGLLLRIGPVVWYRQESGAGLADESADVTAAMLPFGGERLRGIQSLYATGAGQITFDPTLSQTALLAAERETLLEHLEKGGIWVIPILAFALFATIVAVGKAVSLARLPALAPALAERLEQALTDGTAEPLVQQLEGSQAALVEIALKEQTASQRDDRLYARLLEIRNGLERWLGSIALTASVSPLLGLLGTVSGMITTFKLMTIFGAGDANSISSGISEALVTTELGLIVAIPALVAHALMSRKVKSRYAELEGLAIRLSQLPAASAISSERPGEARA
jgi:biopolymer transport protein ExbB